MSDSSPRSPEWTLTLISLVADGLSILTFLGFQANHTVKVTIVLIFSSIGFVTSLTVVGGAVKLFFSVRGAYYPTTMHRRRLALSTLGLVGSLVLGYLALQAV